MSERDRRRRGRRRTGDQPASPEQSVVERQESWFDAFEKKHKENIRQAILEKYDVFEEFENVTPVESLSGFIPRCLHRKSEN